MTGTELSAEQRSSIDDYLRGYSTNYKLLRLSRYEQEFLGGSRFDDDGISAPTEGPLAKARMYEVRHFILSLPNSDEKLLLYYHYVKGESVERCAELIGVSRRTAFRLKSRALAIAHEHAKNQKILP